MPTQGRSSAAAEFFMQAVRILTSRGRLLQLKTLAQPGWFHGTTPELQVWQEEEL